MQRHWPKTRPPSNPGLPMSQFLLGSLYEAGEGVEQSDAKACEWWTRAAEQGHVQAQHNLAMM